MTQGRRRYSHDSESERITVKTLKRAISHIPRGSLNGMGSASPERRKSSAAKPPIQPLRRGDACLMCRAKKLKCSATKPMCDQCSKRKDRCVYDAVRPASRVEKLERKLAEMEEVEMQAVMAAGRLSTDSIRVSNTSFSSATGQNPALGLSNPYDMNMFQYQPPAGSPFMSNQPSASSPGSDHVQSRPHSMPNPHLNSLNNWSWSSSNVFSAPLPQSASGHAEQMPWSLLSSSNDISLWDPVSVDPPPNTSHSTQSAPTGLGFSMLNVQPEAYSMDPAQAVHQHPGNIAQSTLHGDFPLPRPTSPEEGLMNDLIVTSESHAEARGLTQFSEKDISQAARDYLLDLFFCPPRIPSGSEVFSEAQFRTKMNLPLHQRPHSCLVFAMYTVAASSSYIPGVRALAESLSHIASSKLEESINQEDRLLDAINAGRMLGKWLFSHARALEGYQMTCRFLSLALACRLHRIPSSVFNAQDPSWSQGAWPLLGPPKDQWELCERIHSFWSSWGDDRGASVMMPWPSLLRDDLITTPLPRPQSEYLDKSRIPDFRIPDLYLMHRNPDLRPPQFVYAYLCASIHLLYRAKYLETDHGNVHTYTQLATMSKQPFSARRDCPEAYQEIMDASYALQDRLPEQHRMNLLDTPPWDDPDTPLITLCILSARNWLHDLETERDICIAGAREIAAIIKLWIQQIRIDELKDTRNVKLTGRNQNGGPYVLTPWFWNADRLVKGSKALRALGRDDEAQQCSEDATAVIAGLKSFGVLYQLNSDESA